MKSIAVSSGISALLGITEPAMFGVNLKMKYPFYAAMVGSAVGCAYVTLTNVLNISPGAAGIIGFVCIKSGGMLNYMIGIAISLIVGFVLENNKGLPLFDINNFINQGEVVNGKKNDIIEIVYEYTLPRIMNGVYLVGAAVGQGTQSKHEMLTWLHGIMELEVVNQGYNSSYIEIPSKIRAFSNRQENVMFL